MTASELFALEVLTAKVDAPVIKILTAKMSDTSSGFHLEDVFILCGTLFTAISHSGS